MDDYDKPAGERSGKVPRPPRTYEEGQGRAAAPPDLSRCEPREGIATLCALLSRSLLLRDQPPIERLWQLLEALNAGDALCACRAYHALSAALLQVPARRVSGDLWRDYLLYVLLQTPHLLAKQAAGGDTATALPFLREELGILGALCTLTGRELARMIEARRTEARLKGRQARDDIELFSTAVWSGGSKRALPTPAAEAAAPAPFTGELRYTGWQYGEPGLRDVFASDAALEEIYARLLGAGADAGAGAGVRGWSGYAEDLCCFFAAYGYGPLLQTRAFVWQNGLVPLPRAIAPMPEPVFFPRQHEALLEQVIRFMQGETPVPMLLVGGAGMGKTAMALSVPEELPEVRLVLARPEDLHPPLLDTLAAVSLKFLLLLDGVEVTEIPTLLPRLLPPNVLLCVTARQGTLEWARRIEIPPLSGERFTELVCGLLRARGIMADYAAVRSACVDHQVDARDRLSAAAAVRIAASFESESGKEREDGVS